MTYGGLHHHQQFIFGPVTPAERCAFGEEGPLACLALLVNWGYHIDERLIDIFLFRARSCT